MSDVATVGTRPATTAPPATTGLTERAKAERKLGWLLCAPAVFVMLLVAGFPIVYAFWLSLRRSDLRFPDASEFIGLSNYEAVLTSSTWWTDVWNTVIITVCSVTLELVLGMLIAQAMYRAIFARTAIRASVLVPYGAVTVVSAFAWRLAFDPATGFVNNLFSFDTPLFTTRWGSFLVIILAEVWKTTPFIALLLDAVRIYDTVFIMTRGANNTETVSVLGYNQLVNRLNLGLGSAVSILIFFCVILIAVAFTKLLGASPQQRR
jgi:multiple sugar transport system permease protein